MRTAGRVAAAVVWWALAAAVAPAAAQTTTVVVVRHAEKVDDSADPALSPAGTARAHALAHALAHAGVQAIYTTQFQRTRLTAEPLARVLGVEPVVISAGGAAAATHAQDVAARVRRDESGRVVLIVGHSNTVPDIICALGGPDVGRIEDAAYDDLFVLLVSNGGTRLIRSRYGASSLPP